jgi:mono/diheme cytochrome c family protein/Zn-finger nucleic acid-binding protein
METTTFACPSCDATLRLKSTMLPGKRIKCPKCATVFLPPVEGNGTSSRMSSEDRSPKAAPRVKDEEEDQDEERVSAQPRKKAKAAPRLEEEEETPPERPTRRKKKKAPSKVPLVLLLVGGGVLLIGGGVALAVAFWPSQGKPNQVAANNPPALMPGLADANKGPAGGDAQPSQAGRAIFERNGCARCHALAASDRPGKGPNLSRVGANATHTVDWISEYIRNPKAQKPDSRMPGFANKIQAQDLRTLAEYLASLK